MRGLLQASALRPSCHAMPAHPVPCTTLIRCVADTGAKPGPHGLRPPARKGLPLGQPHREFTHHLPQAAALLDSLEVQTSSLQDAMDDLLLDSRMLAEQRRLLEVNFAGRDAEDFVPVRPSFRNFHGYSCPGVRIPPAMMCLLVVLTRLCKLVRLALPLGPPRTSHNSEESRRYAKFGISVGAPSSPQTNLICSQ